MSTTSVAQTTSQTGRGAGRALVPGLAAGGVAAATNLAILFLGRQLGLDFTVQPAGQTPMTIGAVMVLAATLVPLAVGTALLVGVRARVRRARPLLAGAGLAVGVLTAPAPFTASADLGTQAALASMHLATGVIWFLVLQGSAGDREATRAA